MTEAAPPGRRTWADSWIVPALVAVAAFLAFLPSLFGEFTFDDLRFIVQNPHVQSPESWLRFLTDAGTADPRSPFGIVRPLRTMEFAADRALFGTGPFAFHVHSMLWHAASATLLLFVLRRLLGDPRAMDAGSTRPSGGGSRAAFLATLVWAVHPSHVESVAWITSRGDVAMGACSLAAILFALRSKGYDRDLAVSLAFAALAALYKETGIVVCAAVAALRLTKFSRAPVWPYVVVAALYAVYRQSVQVGETGLGVHFVLGGSTLGTIATMVRGFGFYLAQSFLPAFSQDWYMTPSTSFADGAVIAWLAVHAALVGSAVAMRGREPRWTVAVALFYVFLAPVSNVVFSVSIPTAERFMYVPLVGFALAVGLALVRAPRTTIAALVVAAAFAATSAKRSTFWHDDTRLWATIIEDHESPRGRESFAEGIESDAIALREKAEAMPPGEERIATERRVHELLESALANAHQSLEDTYSFEMVARSTGIPAFRAEYNASNICHALGREEEALFHAEEALAINADVDAAPHYDRAWPLLALGFAPQAIRSMQRAREIGPKTPDPWMADFFMRAATDCERRGLLLAARSGYSTAMDVAPAGQIRDAAKRAFDAAVARPRTVADEAREREAIAALDAKLAALPRSCPVRRDHTVRK
jgi:tetratricopeptide (TPR) repeat protein